MKSIHYIWTAAKNLVALAIFIGMLDIAATSFETVVVSGLALIYTTIVTYCAIIVRTQLDSFYTTSKQFLYLAKLHNNAEKNEEIEELEDDANIERETFQDSNPTYYINMFFIFIIWLLAVVSIVGVL